METILDLLFYSLSVASLLFIWFHTYFVAEYYKLFRLRGWALMDSFLEDSKDGYYITFPFHIAKQISQNAFKNWFFKLISCPFCLGFFLSFPALINGVGFFGASYFLSILAYLTIKRLN